MQAYPTHSSSQQNRFQVWGKTKYKQYRNSNQRKQNTQKAISRHFFSLQKQARQADLKNTPQTAQGSHLHLAWLAFLADNSPQELAKYIQHYSVQKLLARNCAQSNYQPSNLNRAFSSSRPRIYIWKMLNKFSNASLFSAKGSKIWNRLKVKLLNPWQSFRTRLKSESLGDAKNISDKRNTSGKSHWKQWRFCWKITAALQLERL